MVLRVLRFFLALFFVFCFSPLFAYTDLYFGFSANSIVEQKKFIFNYEYLDSTDGTEYSAKSDVTFDSGIGASFFIGKSFHSNFSIEFDAGLYRRRSELCSNVHQINNGNEYILSNIAGLFVNVFYSANLFDFLQPYFGGGVGILRTTYDGKVILSDKDSEDNYAKLSFYDAHSNQSGYKIKFGVNYNADHNILLGIGYEYLFTNVTNEFDKHISYLEIDGEQHAVAKSDKALRNVENGTHVINLAFRLLLGE